MAISDNFKRFQYFNFEIDFLENEILFQKVGLPFFSWKYHFHTKLQFQRPMLRQIEWWLQNRPITKNGVLPVTTLFFRKFCFSSRTSIKSWFIVPTTHISTFSKRCGFIWPCFYPVNILKSVNIFAESFFVDVWYCPKRPEVYNYFHKKVYVHLKS